VHGSTLLAPSQELAAGSNEPKPASRPSGNRSTRGSKDAAKGSAKTLPGPNRIREFIDSTKGAAQYVVMTSDRVAYSHWLKFLCTYVITLDINRFLGNPRNRLIVDTDPTGQFIIESITENKTFTNVKSARILYNALQNNKLTLAQKDRIEMMRKVNVILNCKSKPTLTFSSSKPEPVNIKSSSSDSESPIDVIEMAQRIHTSNKIKECETSVKNKIINEKAAKADINKRKNIKKKNKIKDKKLKAKADKEFEDELDGFIKSQEHLCNEDMNMIDEFSSEVEEFIKSTADVNFFSFSSSTDSSISDHGVSNDSGSIDEISVNESIPFYNAIVTHSESDSEPEPIPPRNTVFFEYHKKFEVVRLGGIIRKQMFDYKEWSIKLAILMFSFYLMKKIMPALASVFVKKQTFFTLWFKIYSFLHTTSVIVILSNHLFSDLFCFFKNYGSVCRTTVRELSRRAGLSAKDNRADSMAVGVVKNLIDVSGEILVTETRLQVPFVHEIFGGNPRQSSTMLYPSLTTYENILSQRTYTDLQTEDITLSALNQVAKQMPTTNVDKNSIYENKFPVQDAIQLCMHLIRYRKSVADFQ